MFEQHEIIVSFKNFKNTSVLSNYEYSSKGKNPLNYISLTKSGNNTKVKVQGVQN